MKEFDWEKVEGVETIRIPNIKKSVAYQLGAEDAFKSVANYVPKKLYDKIKKQFFEEIENET